MAELSISDLPLGIRPEVARSSGAQSTYHKIVVRAYTARRSYYLGTRRVLVDIAGTDRDGKALQSGYNVAEVYLDSYGVAHYEFEALWEAAL